MTIQKVVKVINISNQQLAFETKNVLDYDANIIT